MAKRQNTPENVVRIDGEGKTHANGGKITPKCKLRGHGDHTWVTTDEAVDCARCIKITERETEARERLEYAANARDTQDMDFSQGPAVLPAVEPVKDSQGETVTVPVDFDDPSKGRRELDASQGECVIGETTFRESKESQERRERARDEFMDAFRNEAPQTAEAVQALIRRLQRIHNGMTGGSEAFSVVFHEPKNGECPGNEIPPLPAGVHPHTWELAHDGNTQGARDYHMRQARAQEEAYVKAQEAKENDVPPF